MPPSINTATRLPAVVLAAGRSQRYGNDNKLLTPLNGRPLVAHAIRACQRARFVDPVMVVLGHEAERVQAALDEPIDDADVQVLINARWRDGLSTSIHTAIDALPDSARGVLFVPGDMPLMTSAVIDRVAETSLRTDRICFPTVDDRKAHPTAIPRRYFQQLSEVKGDTGARDLIRDPRQEAEALPLPEDERRTQCDVDSNQDYQAAVRTLG